MRINPKSQSDVNSKKINEKRVQKITRKVAIAYVLIVQIAIIYKMLF